MTLVRTFHLMSVSITIKTACPLQVDGLQHPTPGGKILQVRVSKGLAVLDIQLPQLVSRVGQSQDYVRYVVTGGQAAIGSGILPSH